MEEAIKGGQEVPKREGHDLFKSSRCRPRGGAFRSAHSAHAWAHALALAL